MAIQAADDVNMLDEQAVTEEEDLSNYITVDGVIIKQDFDHLIMEENEVDKYTPLQSDGPKAPKYDIKFVIEGQIEVLYFRKKELLQVQWLTSPKNDLIADSVWLLVLQIKENPTP